MKRGELYRVRRPPGDPKPARVFVIVSRQPLIDSAYSTVICAPVFTRWQDLPTQVAVGPDEIGTIAIPAAAAAQFNDE